MKENMAILSIQSHVVYGYAGNTAAVFPMQKLGREVWAINTVEFSNHTGYGAWRGSVLGGELVQELVAGLEERGALPGCEAVLSGYLGDASVARAIAEAVEKARAAAPAALYCCDPVMGDVGRGVYVRPDIPDVIKSLLVPIADIITPNEFELELLSGVEIRGLDDARLAIEKLHEKGPRVVLVTSFRGGDSGSDTIGMIASDKSGMYMAQTPCLPIDVGAAGCGDLTAATFLSRYLETGDAQKALELCIGSIFGILSESWKHFSERASKGQAPGKIMELRIVQAQRELEIPSRRFEARRL
ncbi:MAG: pyridoxal kinase PdxY [Treponema sp.]|nr:pyridoxal kinase PdxY [Treponema sp.]